MTDEATKKIAEMERLAEEVLMDKQQVVDIDRRRNLNRTALREMSHKSLKDEKKVWMTLGNMFVKFPHDDALTLVQQDQTELDKQIDKVRDELKPKVLRLQMMQGQPVSPGWALTGMTEKELSNTLS
eukprot:m.81710 g.81710  ORF g.81710 m.81710 type:complete len:127 (+) comp20999_c0_seq3:220-600(+)